MARVERCVLWSLSSYSGVLRESLWEGGQGSRQACLSSVCVCVCVGSVFVRKGPQVSLGAALSLCVSHKCPGSPDPSSVEPTTSLHTC